MKANSPNATFLRVSRTPLPLWEDLTCIVDATSAAFGLKARGPRHESCRSDQSRLLRDGRGGRSHSVSSRRLCTPRPRSSIGRGHHVDQFPPDVMTMRQQLRTLGTPTAAAPHSERGSRKNGHVRKHLPPATARGADRRNATPKFRELAISGEKNAASWGSGIRPLLTGSGAMEAERRHTRGGGGDNSMLP
ncbi:hypothetical protein PAN31117_05101 [Pandoraea anapnoica]|uniref:Uncharacterized protein n=1 Tax=Pandoraea anapnoica TaxID=2508301 RepID=A0A5E5AQ83_9BURK|nr:hypothetical protein PIN31009_05299 [Pandoraea iniqua]VVE75177.1 hypothetical protein PAN31117_05101 [Pandoraea anapnoica]